ncbi:MAG: PAS domain-containing sensor histidine kinase [Candidatus Altiarchaeota archaeon]|nr:PAS domain-containing sensor histidine kinase [Candidatus Altiarchaeota archaeon]
MNLEQTISDKVFLQSVLDGIEESIVVLDKDYRIVCHNKAFESSLERPKKKITGEYCYSVIHDNPVRCTPCIVRETFRTGQFFESSHSHDLGNGKKSYHETTSYPLKEGNEVKYAIYMFKDITERAAIENEVRELNKFKNKILDNAGVAINILDKDGRIISLNKGSEELFGYLGDEMKGEFHAVFYRKKDGELLSKTMQEALAKGKFDGEVELVKKNKTEFWAHLTLTALDDDRGKPIAFIEIVHDLTQLKKAERVIKQQLEKLKKLDEMKEEYFYSTSHEFKTPLTTIVGLTKMLLDGKLGKLDEKQLEALNLVYCDSKRLRGAVQKVLDIAKIDSDKMVYHMEQLDISPIVDSVLDTVKVLVAGKELMVSKKIENGLPQVLADRERLMMVVENLVSNSIKFTPKGGSIEVRASKDGDNVLVEVHDTGVGIPKGDEEKIFEKYYQVKNGRGDNAGGSGLGLVICKNIVEAFGGRVWVESKLNEGSKFKFTLPTKSQNKARAENRKQGGAT